MKAAGEKAVPLVNDLFCSEPPIYVEESSSVSQQLPGAGTPCRRVCRKRKNFLYNLDTHGFSCCLTLEFSGARSASAGMSGYAATTRTMTQETAPPRLV